MIALPFKQVAIFEPSLCLPASQSTKFVQSQSVALADWLERANSRGADACYVRVDQSDLGREILCWLAKRTNVLAPAGLYDPNLEVMAWHHKSTSQALLPSGDYLQGISGHSISEIQNAKAVGFDYCFLSPIFQTQTHPGTSGLGLKYLKESCATFQIPIVALGGLNHSRGNDCLAAGADGWAGIRCYL